MKYLEVNKGYRRKCNYCARPGRAVRTTIAVINVLHVDFTVGRSWCPFFTTTVHFNTKYATSSEEGPKRISKYLYCVYVRARVCVCVCVCVCVYMHFRMFVCMVSYVLPSEIYIFQCSNYININILIQLLFS